MDNNNGSTCGSVVARDYEIGVYKYLLIGIATWIIAAILWISIYIIYSGLIDKINEIHHIVTRLEIVD